ncbi:leucine-rich repeat domain-containing protein [Candidatus Uabimicrobium amorphum]|uniref:STAS domain-containing protein n=1 Tax=Uabimicrobium amorphum TaxID=2596890 RepID=A0A5S9IMD9_UABAM|nr:STAS domain-containing protein [Candidatus Uabimicrobium amorphum]BBM84539.1 hypothetical protein UABAM_02900 [Candidatus Uabimicrobium amorphum]
MLYYQTEDLELPDLPKIRHVKVIGEMKSYNHDFTLDEYLENTLSQDINHIIVDISGVTIMNSGAIACLFGFDDKFSIFGGKMVLIQVPEKVSSLFDMLGIPFKMHNTLEDAVRNILNKNDASLTRKKTIKSKSLETIENSTSYHGCTFFLKEDDTYQIAHCTFENCSFRTDIVLDEIKDCFFENCNFSNRFCLNLAYAKRLPLGLGMLSSLTHLNLQSAEITKLPWEIRRLSSLTHLDLECSEITKLPPEILGLSSLTQLNLRGAKIRELPNEIGQLSSLTHLYLSGTCIDVLPKEIGQLSSLKVLDLGGTRITELPKEIGQISSLRTIDLSGTNITELPKEITKTIDVVV